MAKRELEPDPTYGAGGIIKMADAFPQVGAMFTGVYLSHAQNTRFEGNQVDYKFKLEGGEGTLTVKSELRDQLSKLAPKAGEQIWIKQVGKVSTPVGDRRTFKAAVDDHKPGSKLSPAPKPREPASVPGAEDPFGSDPFSS